MDINPAGVLTGREHRFLSLLFLSFFCRMKRKKKERRPEMQTFENQNLEFKQEYVADIRKEVIGFANADGGTIVSGK